jgi:hypothetical protein
LVSLTHYGQSRAVSEGIPMMLWINPELGQYGLEAEYSFQNIDDHAVDYQLDPDLRFDIELLSQSQQQQQQQRPGMQSSQTLSPQMLQVRAALAAQTASRFGKNAAVIRFTPDGFIDDSSPQNIWLRDQKGQQQSRSRMAIDADSVWIMLSTNRLRYEIQTNIYAIARR